MAMLESGAILVRLLGPVDVVAGGAPREVSGLRRKAVLATLALHCGEVVDTGHLADVVWGGAAPPTALNTLQTHVSYVRGVLGSRSAIVARAPGYVLDLEGDGTDVRAAERLLREGARAGGAAETVRALRLAHGLWRGRPLADVSGLAWLEQQAERLDALLVRVQRALCEARLAAGEHVQLVPELEQMVAGHALLTARLGADRTTLEPGAVDELIDRCARLPLALTIAAARAATRPGFTLAAIAAELSQAGGVLDSFDTDDLATNVRAVFSWSYQALSAGAARLFRLLGLHPGPDITIPAAASLAAVPPARTGVLLAELTRAHMLAQPSPGRFAFHDLLRAYAAEQAHTIDGQPGHDAAISRVLDHYLHTAHAAVALTDARPEPIALDRPLPGVIIDPPRTADDALAWFTAEHAVLLGAVQLAADTGRDTCVWQFAWTLRGFLPRRARWREHTMVQQAGLDAARRAGDTAGEALCLAGLAAGYCRAGRFQEAEPPYRQALLLLEEIGGHFHTRASIHTGLVWVTRGLERPGEMVSHALQTVEMYRRAGNKQDELMALNNVGWTYALLGNYSEAISYCQQALRASQECGERYNEIPAWHSLGYIHHGLGDHEQAVTCYQRCIDLCRQEAELYGEALALAGLGDVHDDAGDPAAARQAWSAALRIFDAIGHPEGDRVRGKLQDAMQPAGP